MGGVGRRESERHGPRQGELDRDGAPPAVHEDAAAGRLRARLEAAEARTLAGVAAHDQPGGAALANAREDRLARAAGAAADAPGDDDVQPDVAPEREQVEQR